MKIACDFLPKEYKAVRRNLKLLFIAIGAWVLTGVILSYTAYSYRGQLKEVDAQVSSQETTISLLEGQVNAVKYPQGKIRTLIQKFRFIQQAMGSADFAYLEFYQALERTIPLNEDTGRRLVSIGKLKQMAGNTWQLAGAATHWDDILKLEDNLNESIFERPVEDGSGGIKKIKKKNFRGVRVFRVDAGGKEGVTFELEFEFITG